MVVVTLSICDSFELLIQQVRRLCDSAPYSFVSSVRGARPQDVDRAIELSKVVYLVPTLSHFLWHTNHPRIDSVFGSVKSQNKFPNF